MSDQQPSGGSPRARALADLPVEALVARAQELARRWAIALILARPLDRIGEVSLEEISREGSALCAQVLRALESDAEMDRLTGRGASNGREHSALARRLAAIAGARRPADVVGAAEALRGVLWEALDAELRWAGGERSSRVLLDAGDRLAHVCAALLEAAIAEIAPGSGLPPAQPGFAARVVQESADAPGPPLRTPTTAVIVDELESPTTGAAPPDAPSQRIEIRDQRRVEGAAAWVGSIGRQLERFAHDRVPFAVLLVEPLQLEALIEDPGRARGDGHERLALEIEALLTQELRAAASPEALAAAGARDAGSSWHGSITRERPGRYWLLAPGLDRGGAEMLAESLARVLGGLSTPQGRPLAVAIGTASCPQDGLEASALAAHADVDLYAARAVVRGSTRRSSAPADR